MRTDKLTIKQEKFCQEYAKHGNGRQAYIAAGYSFIKDSTADVNASKLLKTAKVRQRLQELRKASQDDAIADIKEMQKVLTAIIRQESDEEVITNKGTGEGRSEVVKVAKKPSTNDVIKAINTLGKMQGAFIDKVQVETDTELNVKVDYGESSEED